MKTIGSLGTLDLDSDDNFTFLMNFSIPSHPFSSPGGALHGSPPSVSMAFWEVVRGLGYLGLYSDIFGVLKFVQ